MPNPKRFFRLSPAALAAVLIIGCSEPAPPPPVDPAATAVAAAVDWAGCRLPGLGLPIDGRVFVVDGGPPPEGAEAGRESIRRVEVVVPGTVSLLLTAPDTTVWHLRISPQTQLRAVLASGDQPQRITGLGLGDAVLVARSQATGAACARYWLAHGAGPELVEASEQVFGKKYDALYGLRAGSVIIGDAETPPMSAADTQVVAVPPAPAEVPAPVALLPPKRTTEEVLTEAVRNRVLRPANDGELQRWLQRNAVLVNKRRDDDDMSRLGIGVAYVVVGDFTVPPEAALSDAQHVLLLIDNRTPVPVNPGFRWAVLDMQTGGCSGRICSFLLD
jgi:hypothetical protein